MNYHGIVYWPLRASIGLSEVKMVCFIIQELCQDKEIQSTMQTPYAESRTVPIGLMLFV